MSTRLSLVVGDITDLDVDVIVNAANASLLGGGGVDGAIHRRAGPGLLEECRTVGGSRPGAVVMTDAYRLPARRVAHAVGPVWDGGDRDEDATLASCYREALEATVAEGWSSVAFPAISTGAYGFPLERAAGIALKTVVETSDRLGGPAEIVFCSFSPGDAEVVRRTALDLGLRLHESRAAEDRGELAPEGGQA